MSDDIKSMIKSRRDERYYGSAYGKDRISKAITDFKDELLPILLKIKNKQPLTPEEETLVERITRAEEYKVATRFREYEVPAYDEGKDYVNAVLGMGGDPHDMEAEIGWQTASHIRGLGDRLSRYADRLPPTAEGKIRNVIRDSAVRMGTEPRAYAADGAKLRGEHAAMDDYNDPYDLAYQGPDDEDDE